KHWQAPPLNCSGSLADKRNVSRTKVKAPRRAPVSGRRCGKNSRGGCLAGRVVGPIAVEPDHAPLDALAEAGKAAVLDDGIVQCVDGFVIELHAAGAIASRDIVGLPGPEGDLVDIAVARNPQLGIPEVAFFFLELRGDHAERLFAWLDPAVIVWT